MKKAKSDNDDPRKYWYAHFSVRNPGRGFVDARLVRWKNPLSGRPAHPNGGHRRIPRIQRWRSRPRRCAERQRDAFLHSDPRSHPHADARTPHRPHSRVRRADSVGKRLAFHGPRKNRFWAGSALERDRQSGGGKRNGFPSQPRWHCPRSHLFAQFRLRPLTFLHPDQFLR